MTAAAAMDLRLRVAATCRKARKNVPDMPWGTALANTLIRDDRSLLSMLEDEEIDPTGYHAGSERYAAAWARLDEVLLESELLRSNVLPVEDLGLDVTLLPEGT